MTADFTAHATPFLRTQYWHPAPNDTEGTRMTAITEPREHAQMLVRLDFAREALYQLLRHNSGEIRQAFT